MSPAASHLSVVLPWRLATVKRNMERLAAPVSFREEGRGPSNQPPLTSIPLPGPSLSFIIPSHQLLPSGEDSCTSGNVIKHKNKQVRAA